MAGMTLKKYAKRRFFQLCDDLREAKKRMDTDQGRKDFIVLSVQLHAAKGTVPKSLWKLAR